MCYVGVWLAYRWCTGWLDPCGGGCARPALAHMLLRGCRLTNAAASAADEPLQAQGGGHAYWWSHRCICTSGLACRVLLPSLPSSTWPRPAASGSQAPLDWEAQVHSRSPLVIGCWEEGR
jgi:hypothetical protein